MAIIYDTSELMGFIERTAVHGQRHAHYQHTIDVADFAKKIMTGDDQGDILISYKLRETDQAKTQRIRVTNSLTQYVGNAVKSQYEELARVDNVIEQYGYTDESDSAEAKVSEIRNALDVFYENDTLTKYLHESVLHLNFYDPNSFIVCEAKYKKNDIRRTEKPTPYPVEVYSEQAVNYEFENGILNWLVARHLTAFQLKADNSKEEQLPVYTIYAAGFHIAFQEVNDKVEYEVGVGWELRTYTLTGGKAISFLVRVYKTDLEICPAVRVGYIKDPETNRETCVTPLWPAEHILKDMIWTKSEYDLCRALHGFYQKFIYAPRCEYTNENGQKCVQGTCGGGVCPKCDGEGLLVHTTVQDVVVLELPRTKTELVPLENLVHYEHIPMDLLKQHKEDLADMESQVMKAIFQRDLINKQEVASTATEIRDIQSSKYNVISTYGQQWSKIWMQIVESVANYQDNEQGLYVEHDFSSDFIIETMSELFDQRQKAVASNAPYSVIRNIDRKILVKQNRDNSANVKMLDAKEAWKPLKEKSESERMAIIMNLSPLHPMKIRYEYFEEIFSEIYAEYTKPPFHELSWSGQKVIIDEIVERIALENEPYVQSQNTFRSILDENVAV